MEIDCCSVGVTIVERSLLTCAGVEAALATLIVSTLVKTQYLFLTQEYMKLLMEPKMRGDHHTCFPCKAIDAEVGDGNEDEDEDEDEEGKEDISYEDGNPGGNKNGPDGEENVNEEDDLDDDDDEANKDDDDDEEDEEGCDDEEDEDEDEAEAEAEAEVVEEEEEEDDEEEEETLQPPKKRKK